ncbi:MAG: molybdate ABC transporter substrate-binding protein [Thermodesulfobacteriota bacterium]
MRFFYYIFLVGAIIFQTATSSLAGSGGAGGGGEITVAVASNALRPVKEIARAFEETAGVKVIIVHGSTGKLFTQIVQGAPFDVFLAADSERPGLLIAKGLAVRGSRFVYARGLLALWRVSESGGGGLASLKESGVTRVAVANPRTAPYGASAVEALRSAGVYDLVEAKLVYGANVSQALSFARTGNADAAIVATSTVYDEPGFAELVDRRYYQPIKQEAVLLKGASAGGASKFLQFTKGESALLIFKKYGYAAD